MSDWYFLRDGGQFGPMAWADLWRHGQSGELRPSDLVWRDGMPEWRVASSVPNLFPASPPAPAPPRPQVPAPQAAPVPQPAPQPQAAPVPQLHGAPLQPVPPRSAGDEELTRWLLPVGRSAWAIAAGYLGLLSFVVVFAPFALLTGILAVVDIRKNPQKHGMGRAIFGIVMGTLGSIILAFMVAAMVASES